MLPSASTKRAAEGAKAACRSGLLSRCHFSRGGSARRRRIIWLGGRHTQRAPSGESRNSSGSRRRIACYREESFGPVKPVIRVANINEAVRVAKDSECGLSAAVFGRDVQRALAVARRIESGICHINGPTVADEPQMPFGGVKASGYGRFGGNAVIEAFTELRWITIEGPQSYPF